MNEAQLLAAGQSAQRKFLAYVEKSVRGDSGTVVCEPPVTTVLPFSIAEKYTLKLKTECTGVAGSGQAQAIDSRFSNNPDGAKAALGELIGADGTSAEVLALCVRRIKNYKYLEKRNSDGSVLLYRGDAKVLDTRDCKHCLPWGAKGWTICEQCDSEGQVECSSCRGKREITCSSCHGARGHTTQTTVLHNGVFVRNDQHWEDCSACRGYGNLKCYACDFGRVKCLNCRGVKTMACAPCGKTGLITLVWGSTVTAAHSLSYNYPSSLDSRAKADLASFLEKTQLLVHSDAISEGLEVSAGTESVFANPEVTVKHKFKTHRTSYLATANSKRTQIRHMGTANVFLDAGGILEELVAGDLAALSDAVRDGRGGVVPRLMRGVLQSGVNWTIVEAVAAESSLPSASAIAGALHNSVGIAYIQNFMSSIAAALDKAHRRRRLKRVAMLLVGLYFIVKFIAPQLICGQPDWFFSNSCLAPGAGAQMQSNFTKSAVEIGLLFGSLLSLFQDRAEKAYLDKIAKPGGATFVKFARNLGCLYGRRAFFENFFVGGLVAYGWAHFLVQRIANA